METLTKLLFLYFVVVATLVESKVIVMPMPGPEFGLLPGNKSAETVFWEKLTVDEKRWMLNSSIVIHLNKIGNTTNSTEEMNMPLTLAPKFLNGVFMIPDQFQQRAVDWIKQYLGVRNDNDLYRLVQGKELCGTEVCSGYPGMGENCCPWG